jgi:hypothetical protein
MQADQKSVTTTFATTAVAACLITFSGSEGKKYLLPDVRFLMLTNLESAATGVHVRLGVKQPSS